MLDATTLGFFAELRKATAIYVIPSVHLSVRPHAKTQLPLDGFS